jgi:hypothetical protein
VSTSVAAEVGRREGDENERTSSACDSCTPTPRVWAWGHFLGSFQQVLESWQRRCSSERGSLHGEERRWSTDRMLSLFSTPFTLPRAVVSHPIPALEDPQQDTVHHGAHPIERGPLEIDDIRTCSTR